MGKPRKKSQSPRSDKAEHRLRQVVTADREPVKSVEPSDQDTNNPQTCCSNCQTVFEVSAELLASTDTRVRCGECLSIFDALANLRDMSVTSEALGGAPLDAGYSPSQAGSDSKSASTLPDAGAAALAGLANDTAALDVTYSDFDLFSEEADLPEVAYFDQTRDTPEFDFDSVELDEDETFNDTLFAHDVTVDARSLASSASADGATSPNNPTTAVTDTAADVSTETGMLTDVDFITDSAPREPLIFNYRDREDTSGRQASVAVDDIEPEADPFAEPAAATIAESAIVLPEVKKTPWLFRSLMFLLLCSIAAGLYLYRERERLYNHPIARPIMVSACAMFKCSIPARVDLQSLRVLQRSVYSHPTIDNALVINVAFRNEADFAQAYPVLLIRLSDTNGRVVAKRDFLPIDYLRDWQAGDRLDAGKRLDISLEVNDPGRSARSFELDFRTLQ